MIKDKLIFESKFGDISVDVSTNLSSDISKDASKKYIPECVLIDVKKIDESTKRSIESKIHRLPKDGCWVWTGAKTEKGYGTIFIDGTRYRAHRLVYELYIGKIPPGMLVCHKCDNPWCVNPDHLWIGTNAENQQDKHDKGRGKGWITDDENRARLSELHKGNTYNLGRVLTEDHKAKLSTAHSDKVLSDEHKAKIATSLTGRECSEETKEMLRAKSTGNTNALGYKFSDEAKIARSKSMTGNTNGKGKVRSPESRERYRQAALRRVMSAETKAKISESLKGKTNALGHSLSDSAKARISEANKGNTNTLGKTLSEEHKAKISTSLMGNTINLGRKQDPEIVAKRIAKTHETMRINKLNNI